MSYKVCRSIGDINIEALPVAKITSYPLEKADYKPFAQSILAIGGNGDYLFLRMWSFEVFQSPLSELRGLFNIFKDRSLSLHVKITASPVSASAWIQNSDSKTDVALDFKPHNGEDLQGVYWGADVQINSADLNRISETIDLSSDNVFKGNFYKIRQPDEKSGAFFHMGSFYNAEFPDHPYSCQSMGDFSIISY